MNPRYQTYFTLLRNALWGTAEDPATIDKNLVTFAQRQATGTLIADQLLLLTQEPSLRLACKSLCAHSMMAQEEQRRVRQTAFKALQAGGITPVLLKGLTLARNYPKPYLRSCSDVDIYVGKANYHQGAAILRETFPDAPRFDTEEDYFKHYNMNIGSTPLEMHRVSAAFAHPKDERLYDALEREALQEHFVTYKDAEDAWNEPEPKFNILFVFIHSWHHFVTETANLRQLCDLVLLLSAYHRSASQSVSSVSLQSYLHTNLKQLHLLQAWQLYAYIMVTYLGLPKDQCPLYTASCAPKAELVLEYILQGRQLHSSAVSVSAADSAAKASSKRPAPKNIILRKLYTLRKRWRAARAVSRIEPHFARHMVVTAFAQSWQRFKSGTNTRHWE